jgi:hypothetical protein
MFFQSFITRDRFQRDLPYSLERLSTYKDGGLEEEMRAVTIKALEKFWSITQMPMVEDNKTM